MRLALIVTEFKVNNYMNTHNKIQELKSKIRINEEEVKLKNIERISLEQELFEFEWPVMTWSGLRRWLKENRPENKFKSNPIVKSLNGHHTYYCQLNELGDLQIGPYEHTDGFPKGKDIRVAYDFRNWG